MASIGRIDQAVLLLQERLARLGNRKGEAASEIESGRVADTDPVRQLQALSRRGQLAPDELRKALVRALLADTLGNALGSSLEFQGVADDVAKILAENERGRELLDHAIAELGLA